MLTHSVRFSVSFRHVLFAASLQAWLTVLAVAGGGAHAHAQVAGEATNAAADAPDVVVLTDGGFIRGTLVEHAPGQYAVLLTLTGQLRRFEASEMTYAGAAARMPQAPRAPGEPSSPIEAAPASAVPEPVESPPPDGMVEVRFEADTPLEIFERTGVSTTGSGDQTGESYASLCVTPCKSTLRRGTYTLGVAPSGQPPMRAETLTLYRPATIHAEYRSGAGVRVGGVLLWIGSLAGGTALMLTGIGDEGGLGGAFYAGAVLGGIGTIVGMIMARHPDSASMRRLR